MNKILKKPLHRIGYDFIYSPFLPEGKDEYYLRDQQRGNGRAFRKLTAHEIEVLVKNENQADDWTDILVSDKFDPSLVKNCHFHGRVRIGALENFYLEYHELQLAVGLYNSTIVACDIGDNVVIKNVNYLAHYLIGDEVILFNINEMHTTNHAKFGNGIVKDGEDEEVRIWLEVANENGGRKILPFEGIQPADAFLWAKFRHDKVMLDRFREMTENAFDARRGYYGTVGDRSVIKNTRILKDVKIGSDAYIKGANKLKNLTIQSSPHASSQIGEGVEMVNGIIGYGSRAFYGVKAVRFVMGENTCLKYGARLINSYLGDNSTISCCEVLNALILPAHEQHHNNSFLCAATVLGQSNIAAGATIGSNHNSRGADGEMVAGRGFWPALCVSLKHNSKFASYTLIAKGAYPAEINNPFPFSLISNNESENCLQIMPAYWFMYNMYALARNSWKFGNRDNRKFSKQILHFDYLAPDTVNEIFEGMTWLEKLVGEAYLEQAPQNGHHQQEARAVGKKLLMDRDPVLNQLQIHSPQFESGKRTCKILKAVKAYQVYRQMVHYFAIKSLLRFGEKYAYRGIPEVLQHLHPENRQTWYNVGGQLVPEDNLDVLRQRIRDCEFDTWEQLHEAYHEMNEAYIPKEAAFALSCLAELYEVDQQKLEEAPWKAWVTTAIGIQQDIARATQESRGKDYHNPFRTMTFESEAEMNAVLGELADNSFIQQIEKETLQFEEKAQAFVRTLSPSS